MLALAAAELLALVFGMSASHWLDGAATDLDHAEGAGGALLGWLHVGKVPILALMVAFLTSFAVTGFAVQFMVGGLMGHPLPVAIAAGIALFGAVFTVRVFGSALSKMIPKDQSSAVLDASLVGRVATIVIGTASAGNPAQARTRDQFGGDQYVMVEPEDADQRLEAGVSVLLVRHICGRQFSAIPNPKPELLQ